MKVEIFVPAVGESITEATIAEWKKKNGDMVSRDEVLLVLETDKASVEVVAENDGRLTTKAEEGSVVKVGAAIGEIDTSVAGESKTAVKSAPPPPPTAVSAPQAFKQVAPSAPPAQYEPSARKRAELSAPLSPAVRRIVTENNLDPSLIAGHGKDGRLTKADVLSAVSQPSVVPSVPMKPAPIPLKVSNGQQVVRREPMTTLRKRIAERLVEAQHTAAILTTFNEIDMSQVIAVRQKYKDAFKEKYDVSLGFMGFLVKAAIEALKKFPRANASIEGTDILYKDFYNIGIAVGTERGLIVPVIRDADQLSLAEIELQIREYAKKARDGKVSMDDLSGGTFTITNGGVYGSLMSTPILNPPQSAILGMHKIEERPVAVAGKVEIRPMMYVALSYDHRIIDGQESVSFLVRVKECIEDPTRLLLEI